MNVPSAGHIAVIDWDKRTVIATWPVTQARANYPMALDEPHHRLLIGCRNPARLLVYDTTSGQVVTTVEIVGDTDDLFYDAAKRRLYVIGGEGFITVLEQQDPDHYRTIQKVVTAAGARTRWLLSLNWDVCSWPCRTEARRERGIRIFSVVD